MFPSRCDRAEVRGGRRGGKGKLPFKVWILSVSGDAVV